MIEASGLVQIRAGRRVVDQLDLRVDAGEIVGLLGPNGAGKTTVLRALCGVQPPAQGIIRLAGRDLATDPDGARRLLGYAPETPPLYGELSVAEQLHFGAALHGVSDPSSAVRRTLAEHGLDEVARRPCSRLSQGWRRRVGTALALVHDPQVVILDEPTTGLDPTARGSLRQLVRGLATRGRAVLWSTHELAEAEATCDRVHVMDHGRLVATVDLRAHTGQSVRLQVADGGPALLEALATLPGVTTVARDDEALLVRADRDVRVDVARIAAPHGLLSLGPADDLARHYLAATQDDRCAPPS